MGPDTDSPHKSHTSHLFDHVLITLGCGNTLWAAGPAPCPEDPMNYCSTCRRRLNGALNCPGCGRPAEELAPEAAATEQAPGHQTAADPSAGDRPGSDRPTGDRPTAELVIREPTAVALY